MLLAGKALALTKAYGETIVHFLYDGTQIHSKRRIRHHSFRRRHTVLRLGHPCQAKLVGSQRRHRSGRDGIHSHRARVRAGGRARGFAPLELLDQRHEAVDGRKLPRPPRIVEKLAVIEAIVVGRVVLGVIGRRQRRHLVTILRIKAEKALDLRQW